MTNLFTEIAKERHGTPVVWSIAGSDSSGGAGVQADLKTFTVLGSYGTTVLTAVTAQNTRAVHSINPVGEKVFQDQLNALSEDLVPQAVKIGLIASADQASQIVPFLNRFKKCFSIYDPVRVSTSGTAFFSKNELQKLIKNFLPHLDLITPNISEAEDWLQLKIKAPEDIQTAAQKFCERGAKSVLIKGGHVGGDFCSDYFFDGTQGFWVTTSRISQGDIHGTGCSFSSAIAHFCAKGYDVKDAIVLAKIWQQQVIRFAQKLNERQHLLGFHVLPEVFDIRPCDFPWVTKDPFDPSQRPQFQNCGEKFGLYTIVPDLEWLKRHIDLGVTTIQLRIKNIPVGAIHELPLQKIIHEAVNLAKQKNCKLFINDHWREAITAGAYGVHLGQKDLDKLDPKILEKSGLRLGISTHSYFEAARAHYYRPSTIALGPIFPTDSHPVSFSPQGTHRLRIWKKLFGYPLIAIGGIHLSNATQVLAEDVHGVCVMSEMQDEVTVRTKFSKWKELFRNI